MLNKGSAGGLQMGWAAAIVMLLVLIDSTTSSPTQQAVFGQEPLQDSPGPPAPPSSRFFQSVHLSHSGVYLDSPLSVGAPPYLVLSVESSLYDLETVKINIGPVKQRSWDKVHLECGSLKSGGIEACEHDDIHEMNTTTVQQVTQPCDAFKVLPSESRLLISTDSCPSLTSLMALDARSRTGETYLESVTLSFDMQRVFPSRKERHLFWIGKVVRPLHEGYDGKALWPYALEESDGEEESISHQWTGRAANRVSSQMQDPYLPKSYRADASDVLNGVDLFDSTWSPDLAILSPVNSNVSKPKDRKLEAVHAPVGGQVVWLGNYTIAQAPSNHRNDEHGFAIMIRDEWGFVYQILGLDPSAIEVKLGQVIEAGFVIGASPRTPFSWEPPCRHKPADPPEMYDNSRRYPYRNRVLRVRVARPDPKWTQWKGPLEAGWQFFNPLDAFTSSRFDSNVPPDVNPRELFFARPSEDGGLTPPSIFSTTKDIFQPPTLSGAVEIIIGFDAFISTPGYSSDELLPTALYALEWAVWPKTDGGESPVENCSVPSSVEWRTTFEHAKLPNNWATMTTKNTLLAHYVPAFLVGTIPFFKTKYASAFDDKSRKLYYAPTRNNIGLPDGRGYWDTRQEPTGDGTYEVWVRGRDWFGNVGCFGANVRIKNN